MKNVNQNANVIVFPPDMELRKVRKPRKKKKSSGRKKEAIEELKRVLQEYDMLVSEAKQKNISLPARLGQLPTDINQIDSLTEIQTLIADITARNQEIRELIQKGEQPTFRALFPTQGLPPVFPQQPQIQPQPVPIRPVQPGQPVQPVPPQPQPVQPDSTEKTLDQIRQEILSKLTPEQRAKAEAELEREKPPAEPAIPGEPSVPEPAVEPLQPDADFMLEKGVQVGDKRIDIVAPPGFVGFVDRVRRFTEDVLVSPVVLVDGFYEIPVGKYDNLEEQRKKILAEYEQWEGKLNDRQASAMDTDPQLSALSTQIFGTLNQNVRDTLKNALEAQGKPVEQVAGGPVESSVAKKIEKGESLEDKKRLAAFRKFAKGIKDQTRRDSDAVEFMTVFSEYDSVIGNLNKRKAKLESEYDKLSRPNKVSALKGFNLIREQIDDTVRKTEELKDEAEASREPTPQTPPVEPVEPVEPPEGAEPAPEPIITPTKKGRPRERKLSPDEKTLVAFLKKNKENEYSSADRQALERIIDANPVLREDRTRLIRQLETGNKLENLAGFLRKTVGLSEKLWTPPLPDFFGRGTGK